MKELKVAPPEVPREILEEVESGEGIERWVVLLILVFLLILLWNPVKELKVELSTMATAISMMPWNPVKELKATSVPSIACSDRHAVESGEGIERLTYFSAFSNESILWNPVKELKDRHAECFCGRANISRGIR